MMFSLVLEGGGTVEMQEDTQRVHRFIRTFEALYGRKPTPEDAEGNFKMRVAQEMQMSVGGARYYLRLAAELEEVKTRTTEPRKNSSS
jgi:hypothetical protein